VRDVPLPRLRSEGRQVLTGTVVARHLGQPHGLQHSVCIHIERDVVTKDVPAHEMGWHEAGSVYAAALGAEQSHQAYNA
jgi:hypothetical protein